MRVTYGDLKASRIPKAAGICATDARLLAWTNEAQHRLLMKGKWWGTCPKIRICATNSCLTLPPQVATIEAVALDGRPIPIRDQWWEFLDNGAGIRGKDSCMSEAVARGHYCTFADVNTADGVDKKLQIACDLFTDVGKTVLLLGYDENGNWIRTLQSGVYMDGEVVTLAQAPGTLSTKKYTVLSDIQLPDNMDGQTWLWEYNTSDTTLRMIGHYQYFETRPSYARYFFPSIKCPSSSSGCGTVSVEAIVKLEFVPVKQDTDYLIIQNLPALKEMIVGLKDAENEPVATNKLTILTTAVTSAMAILDDELSHYLGDGRTIGIQLVGSSIGQVDPVLNMI